MVLLAGDAETELGGEFDTEGADATTQLERNYYLPEAGPCFVRVRDFFDDESDYDRPFQLTVTLLDVPDGAAEPNGGSDNPDLLRTLATPLSNGVETQGFLASKEDDDWYALAVEGESILQVELHNLPAAATPLDLEFTVLAPDAVTELGREYDTEGEDATTLLVRNVYAPAAGTYFLRVRDFFDDEYDYERPYRLTATVLPVPDAAAEPNGNTDNPDLIAQTATPLSSGVPATGFLAAEGDDDWFVAHVGGAGTLQVTLDNGPAVSSPLDFELEVFGPDPETEVGEPDQDFEGEDGTTRLSVSVNVQPGTAVGMLFWNRPLVRARAGHLRR